MPSVVTYSASEVYTYTENADQVEASQCDYAYWLFRLFSHGQTDWHLNRNTPRVLESA